MKTSEAGVKFISQFEGFRGTAYKCVPTEEYLTIGYGHYGPDVKKSSKITKEDALKLLALDIRSKERNVDKYNKKYHFTQNQYDALVSFAYNIGSIDQLTAKGTRNIKDISEHIIKYNTSGGKVLAGLTKRRTAEQKLFNK